ncbi:MAG: methylated-DNA--[protein]-cysteine S-methyltransferase [Pseudomonadota bacterium]|nr:methylated-DNA--[protein]-cysteine S-methyltransferase [Pseudomonadota bacterium]
MNPLSPEQSRTYRQIASAIEFVSGHRTRQPSLGQVAAHLGLSEWHLQRLFSRWVGVSPKQFLKFLTKQEALRRLRENSVLETALECGLSGPGRLHDLMVTCEGVTPGEYQRLGQGLGIDWGFHDTPFGGCLLAQTQRGICKLGFYDSDEQRHRLLQELEQDWPRARLRQAPERTGPTVARIFAGVGATEPLHLLLKGSPFQIKVWEALLRIPEGRLCSYGQLAGLLDAPSATRAVASAVAQNPIGYLIPCHRVIRSTGEFNQYRWGAVRKQALIGWEGCRERK